MFGTIGKSMLAVGGTMLAGTLGIATAIDGYDAVKSGAKRAAKWATSSKSETRSHSKKKKSKAKAKKPAARRHARRRPEAMLSKNRKAA